MSTNNGSRPSRPRRGGRRPGAGAPKGNLNALRHGANSRQIQQLALALSLVPEARKALARLARRQRRQQARARTVAVTLLSNLLRASLQSLEASSASGGDNQPPTGACPERSRRVPDSVRPIRSSNSRNINQTPQSTPQSQSNPGGPPPLSR